MSQNGFQNIHSTRIVSEIGFDVTTIWEPKTKKYHPSRRRIMSRSTEYKHKPIPEIENKLYPDYDHGSYQRMYIELKEED